MVTYFLRQHFFHIKFSIDNTMQTLGISNFKSIRIVAKLAEEFRARVISYHMYSLILKRHSRLYFHALFQLFAMKSNNTNLL